MAKPTRVFAGAVAVQFAVVAWLALLAFLTPGDVNLILSLGLVVIGTLLALSAMAWWRAEAFSAEVRVFSVAAPCIPLLGLCLAGWLPFDPTTSGLANGLVALLSVALVLASARMIRAAVPPALVGSQQG